MSLINASNTNPKAKIFFKFLSTLLHAIQYGAKGFDINWLSLFIANANSCLIKVAYCRGPMILLYTNVSMNESHFIFDNFSPIHNEVVVPLHSFILIFFRSFDMYLICERISLFFVLVTFMPKKKCNCPKFSMQMFNAS